MQVLAALKVLATNSEAVLPQKARQLVNQHKVLDKIVSCSLCLFCMQVLAALKAHAADTEGGQPQQAIQAETELPHKALQLVNGMYAISTHFLTV